MVERHDVAHGADPQTTRARPGADCIETRRRYPALVGTEVMLDAEAVIEAKLVAQLQFAPQLFIALMRRHSGLAPDMREMCELHPAILATTSSCPALVPGILVLLCCKTWVAGTSPAMTENTAAGALVPRLNE